MFCLFILKESFVDIRGRSWCICHFGWMDGWFAFVNLRIVVRSYQTLIRCNNSGSMSSRCCVNVQYFFSLFSTVVVCLSKVFYLSNQMDQLRWKTNRKCQKKSIICRTRDEKWQLISIIITGTPHTKKNTEIRFHLKHVNVFVSLFANQCQSYNCCVRFNFDCF